MSDLKSHLLYNGGEVRAEEEVGAGGVELWGERGEQL